MMKLARLGHVALRVGDVERSKEFYGEVLGLRSDRGRPRARRRLHGAGGAQPHDRSLPRPDRAPRRHPRATGRAARRVPRGSEAALKEAWLHAARAGRADRPGHGSREPEEHLLPRSRRHLARDLLRAAARPRAVPPGARRSRRAAGVRTLGSAVAAATGLRLRSGRRSAARGGHRPRRAESGRHLPRPARLARQLRRQPAPELILTTTRRSRSRSPTATPRPAGDRWPRWCTTSSACSTRAWPSSTRSATGRRCWSSAPPGRWTHHAAAVDRLDPHRAGAGHQVRDYVKLDDQPATLGRAARGVPERVAHRQQRAARPGLSVPRRRPAGAAHRARGGDARRVALSPRDAAARRPAEPSTRSRAG